MAWNEPGNSSGKRNPWERQTGNGAGGGASSGPGSTLKKWWNNGPAAGTLTVLLLATVGVIWLGSGWHHVPVGYVGVVSRLGVQQRLLNPGYGLHLPWPLEVVQVVNVSEQQQAQQLRVLTGERALIDVLYNVRYRCTEPTRCGRYLRTEQPFEALGESVIREVFAAQTLVYGAVSTTNHHLMAQTVEHRLQALLDAGESGITVYAVDIQDVRLPSDVRADLDELSKAKRDRDAAVSLAKTYASELPPKATGAAAQLHEQAVTYKTQRISKAASDTEQFLKLLPEYQKAPDIMRERLYIETMESLYGAARKVFVDSQNNVHIHIDAVADTPGVTVEGKSASSSSVGSARSGR